MEAAREYQLGSRDGRKIALCNDFPTWAQENAIERCLKTTSATAASILTRALPVLQVDAGADIIELDAPDYSGITCNQLTAQDQVQRISRVHLV